MATERPARGVSRGRLVATVAVASALAVVAAACSGGGEGAGDDGDLELIIPDTTKVLDGDALEALGSVSEGGTLAFSETTEVVRSLELGDVVAAGVSEHTPEGLLRKVTSISESGGRTVVETEQAALEEAIQQGHIEDSFELTLDDVADGADLPEGVMVAGSADLDDLRDRTDADDGGGDADDGGDEGASGVPAADLGVPVVAQSAAAGAVLAQDVDPDEDDGDTDVDHADSAGLVVAFDDVPLLDSGDARLTVSGTVAVAPDFNLVIRIRNFAMEEASITLGVSEAVTLRLRGTGEATLREERTVATIPFAPIIIPAGPIPLVVTPRLEFVVGADGTLRADLNASVVQQANASTRFGYFDGGFGSDGDSDASFIFDAPIVDGEVAGRVYAGGRLAICLYEVLCGTAQANGFIGLEAEGGEPPPCVSWELSAGLEVTLGFRLSLALASVDERANLAEIRDVLDAVDCDDPTGGSRGDGVGPRSWARSYAVDRGAAAYAIERTSDGGSIVAASGNFEDASGPLWVLKLDPAGEIQWQRSYTRSTHDPTAVREVDGGYLVLTRLGTVLRLDVRGGVQWARTYDVPGATGSDHLHGLAPTGDGGGVLIGGVSTHPDSAQLDIWALRFDPDGDVVWSRGYGGPGVEIRARGIVPTGDGGVVLAGQIGGATGRAWLARLDGSGAIAWQKEYQVVWPNTDGASYARANGVWATDDGGFVVAGTVGAPARDWDCRTPERAECPDGGSMLARGESAGWMLRVDGGGDVVWSTATIPWTDVAQLEAVTQSGDGFVAAGNLGDARSARLWVLRVDGSGNLSWSTSYGGPRWDGAGPNGILRLGSQYLQPAGGGAVLVGATSESLGQHPQVWVLKLTRTGLLDVGGAAGLEIRGQGGQFADATSDDWVRTGVSDTRVAAATLPHTVEDVTGVIDVASTRATELQQGQCDDDCPLSTTPIAFLGVVTVDVSEVLPAGRDPLGIDVDEGAFITEVRSGSSAERAGLQVGDVILAIDGNPVRTSREAQLLAQPRTDGSPGLHRTDWVVRVRRGGDELDLTATDCTRLGMSTEPDEPTEC